MDKYTLNPDCQIDSFSDGETVVYESKNEQIHVLNETASDLLKIITSQASSSVKQDFIKTAKKKYDNVSDELLSNDYEFVIDELKNKGIIIEG